MIMLTDDSVILSNASNMRREGRRIGLQAGLRCYRTSALPEEKCELPFDFYEHSKKKNHSHSVSSWAKAWEATGALAVQTCTRGFDTPKPSTICGCPWKNWNPYLCRRETISLDHRDPEVYTQPSTPDKVPDCCREHSWRPLETAMY